MHAQLRIGPILNRTGYVQIRKPRVVEQCHTTIEEPEIYAQLPDKVAAAKTMLTPFFRQLRGRVWQESANCTHTVRTVSIGLERVPCAPADRQTGALTVCSISWISFHAERTVSMLSEVDNCCAGTAI